MPEEKQDELKTIQVELEDGTQVETIKKEDFEKTKSTYETQLKSVQEKLEKLEQKDYNFSKFRQMNKGEKEEFLKTKTETEKLLISKAEELETKQEEYLQSRIKDIKDDALSVLIGDDF